MEQITKTFSNKNIDKWADLQIELPVAECTYTAVRSWSCSQALCSLDDDGAFNDDNTDGDEYAVI